MICPPLAGGLRQPQLRHPSLKRRGATRENWDEFEKAGIGLLLFGNVGTGKSYAAGCIANALIDRLESVLFVGMSDVVNRMQGNFGADRDHYTENAYASRTFSFWMTWGRSATPASARSAYSMWLTSGC